MGSHKQNTTGHQESSATMDGVAQGTEQIGRKASSSCLNLASANPSGDVISDSLNHADHLHGQSTSSNCQLSPIVYTKHHFEVLKLGAAQYTIDTLRRHEELGVVITRKEIERHWRKQIKGEYSKPYPQWTTLEKRASFFIFLRWHMRDADLSSSQLPRLSNSLTRVEILRPGTSWPHA